MAPEARSGTFLEFRNRSLYPDVVNPYDLAVFAIAFAGACGGFLWWNALPARIFMGDVSALGIGAALAVSGVSILLYYGIAHLSALTLGTQEGRPPRPVMILGLLGCVVVAAALVGVWLGELLPGPSHGA
mgnify:CR=1 FL=1